MFIDGDPNWYTVYNELKLIEENNEKFPLIFVFNAKFPYAYQDAYYNPDDIPSEYRQEYCDKFSVNYEESGHIKYIPIQDKLKHSLYKNTQRNGVLKAIEDYVSSTKLNIGNITLVKEDNLVFLYDKDSVEQSVIDEIFSKYKLDSADKLYEKIGQLNYLYNEYDNQSFQTKIYKQLVENINKDLPDIQLNKLIIDEIDNIETTFNNPYLSNEEKEEAIRQFSVMNQYNLINRDIKDKLDDYLYQKKTIEYLQFENRFSKKVLSGLSYLLIIYMSRSLRNIKLNLKLYRLLKNLKWFNVGFYLCKYPDLSSGKWYKIFNPITHYVCKGHMEQRMPNPYYDKHLSKEEIIKTIEEIE